ncbi:glucose dehydrogenase [bacterium]|nr:glucose dehydrogenase [Chloroflexi bacterium CFX6]RIL12416.1 MAG: glucose dehydrogenase [bacterium]
MRPPHIAVTAALVGVIGLSTGCRPDDLPYRPATPGSPTPPVAATAPIEVPPSTAVGTATPAPSATVSAAPSGTGTRASTALPAPPATARARPWPPSDLAVALEPLVEGLDDPVAVVDAGDGSGRLFVVERQGVVRVVRDGTVAEPAFLDLRDRVTDDASEQGLLGLAFHPRYPADDRLFVDYTDGEGDTVVGVFRAPAGTAVVDASAESVLLRQDQPAANHNGGHLAFGPDGYLYIGFGDGGTDHRANAQRPGTWLGKILRVDVDADPPYPAADRRYGIPASNPFAADPDFLPEIWAYGLRNPWRFGFDRLTGDLFIGDVGAGAWEEIDHQPAGDAGGRNYGWPIYEADGCYREDPDCDSAIVTVAPILSYPHEDGNCAVTGGTVYRGAASPALWGVYLYADYCSGRVWGAARDSAGAWRSVPLLDSSLAISSFGEDAAGEVYATDLGGGVYRVRATDGGSG